MLHNADSIVFIVYICTAIVHKTNYFFKSMEKAFEFVRNLKPSFFEFFGFPSIEPHSDFCEVRFQTYKTIKSIDLLLEYASEELRMYACENSIIIVFTFYN